MSGSLRVYLSNHERLAQDVPVESRARRLVLPPSLKLRRTAVARSAKAGRQAQDERYANSTARQDLSPSARRHRLREHGRRWLRVWRARNPSRRVNLRLVEALVDEELSDDRIEPAAILSDQPPRF